VKPLYTVNVIEVLDGNNFNVASLRSYPDTPEGNQAAEKVFRQLVEQTGDDDNKADLDSLVEDGYCEIGSGFIALVHSTHND